MNDADSLKKIETGTGICAAGTIVTNTSICTSLTLAAQQDLERFRVLTTTPADNRCTLHVTGVVTMNRPEILTKMGF